MIRVQLICMALLIVIGLLAGATNAQFMLPRYTVAAPPATFIGDLDTVPSGIAGWWGFEAASSADRGTHAVRVCQPGGGTCADVATDISTGQITSATVTTAGMNTCNNTSNICLVGRASVASKGLYDKSGNANDMTPTSAGGVFVVPASVDAVATGTVTISGTTMTVAASPAPTGTWAVGLAVQPVTGTAIAVGTTVTALVSGVGGAGTYTVSISQTVSTPTAATGGGCPFGATVYCMGVTTPQGYPLATGTATVCPINIMSVIEDITDGSAGPNILLIPDAGTGIILDDQSASRADFYNSGFQTFSGTATNLPYEYFGGSGASGFFTINSNNQAATNVGTCGSSHAAGVTIVGSGFSGFWFKGGYWNGSGGATPVSQANAATMISKTRGRLGF